MILYLIYVLILLLQVSFVWVLLWIILALFTLSDLIGVFDGPAPPAYPTFELQLLPQDFIDFIEGDNLEVLVLSLVDALSILRIVLFEES